jgi:hypothetical protein
MILSNHMPGEEPQAPLIAGLSKEQKVGFILLLIFAVLTVGLGVLQIRNTMYAPFALNNKVAVAVKDQVNTIDALRFRDTDHDGLADFDELYVYATSPYLYDTFSYGKSDKQVIDEGLPLCPKGQDCGSPITSGGAIPTNGSSTVAVAVPNPGTPPPDLLQTFSSPAQVREMLVNSGADPKLLNRVSDEELMLMVKEVIQSTSTMESIRQISGGLSNGQIKP